MTGPGESISARTCSTIAQSNASSPSGRAGVALGAWMLHADLFEHKAPNLRGATGHDLAGHQATERVADEVQSGSKLRQQLGDVLGP